MGLSPFWVSAIAEILIILYVVFRSAKERTPFRGAKGDFTGM